MSLNKLLFKPTNPVCIWINSCLNQHMQYVFAYIFFLNQHIQYVFE